MLNKLINRLASRSGKKALVMLAAVVIGFAGITTSTLAWLIDETPEVRNTFTYGDIEIDLEETDTDGDDDGDPTTPEENTYEMVPGNSIAKDPVVTVLADSEDCWLFVKIDESENFGDFMEYDIAEGWIALEGFEGVYYRAVDKAEADQEFPVLLNNEVRVRGDVTSDMLHALDTDGANNYPTMTITSYAVQRDAEIEAIDTAVEAWEIVLADQTENEG